MISEASDQICETYARITSGCINLHGLETGHERFMISILPDIFVDTDMPTSFFFLSSKSGDKIQSYKTGKIFQGKSP